MSQTDLDINHLMMLQELLADRFDELIETYLNDSQARLTSIIRAIHVCDLDAICKEAHGLKGSSRNIGANSLAELCEVLENQTREGELAHGQQQLAAIQQKAAAVSEHLKTFLS